MVFAIQCSFSFIRLFCSSQDDIEEVINPYATVGEFPVDSDRRGDFFFALGASRVVIFFVARLAARFRRAFTRPRSQAAVRDSRQAVLFLNSAPSDAPVL